MYKNKIKVMKKVIGYVRVSSESQMLRENSIINQKEMIVDYCKRYNYELVEIFEDLGISGLRSDRVGLSDLMDRVKKSDIEGVVVYSLSRLGRKLTKVIEVIELFKKKNIDFISIKENFNVNEIYGKLMLNILGSLNEFEVNVMGERIRDVKQNMKSENKVYCGDILYGMYKRGKRLIKNPFEIKTLKVIKEMRDENVSYNKISNYLNDLEIPSKNKSKWYSSSVRSVYLNGVIEKFSL